MPITQSFITGSVGAGIRGENRLVQFTPGFGGWGPAMNRNLELISQGMQWSGNHRNINNGNYEINPRKAPAGMKVGTAASMGVKLASLPHGGTYMGLSGSGFEVTGAYNHTGSTHLTGGFYVTGSETVRVQGPVELTGTLNFGSQNVWMTRSQIISFFPTASIYASVSDPSLPAPGMVHIPLFAQVENGIQTGPGQGNLFKRMNYMIKQVSFWVRAENTYSAGNTWRFRVFHTSSTSGNVRVMSWTQNRPLNSYEPLALMNYSDAFELSSSEAHHVYLQINKQSGTPSPLEGAGIKVTYLVANDPGTFALG